MIICSVDVILEEDAPPTREVIEMQRRQQMEALSEARRSLIERPRPAED
jgi:hypothetical protein